MEPGHEDREYSPSMSGFRSTIEASMEPGHEDREYRLWPPRRSSRRWRLNGARS